MVELAVVCFVLPDGRFVLQRRSQDAQTSPRLLGFFGGHIEKDETPEEAVKREISEETSLSVDQLKIELIGDYFIKADDSYPKDRHTFLFRSSIKNMDFEVYEGDRAEAYTESEIKKRNDVIPRVRYLLNIK